MFNKREAVCLSEGVGEVDGASEGSGSSIASSLSTFTQQVAGHKGENQMLLDESGRSIFKPLNSNEALFYRTLNDAIGKDSTFPAHFFPTFMGTTAHNGREYIQLGNLTYGMKEPCVCDLKMGGNSKGTNPDAGFVKGIKQGLVKQITTSRTLGFRIVGLRSYQKETQTYTVKSMLYGTKLRASSMIEGLALYLDNGQEIRSDVIPTMLKKIDEIIAWIEKQEQFVFRSSSILLLYDGGDFNKVDVRMIDFAHSYPQAQKGVIDEDYLFGMRNLRRLLDEIYRHESLVGSSTAGGLLASSASERRRLLRKNTRNIVDDCSEWLQESDLLADETTEENGNEEEDELRSSSSRRGSNTSLIDLLVSGSITPQRQASSSSLRESDGETAISGGGENPA